MEQRMFFEVLTALNRRLKRLNTLDKFEKFIFLEAL